MASSFVSSLRPRGNLGFLVRPETFGASDHHRLCPVDFAPGDHSHHTVRCGNRPSVTSNKAMLQRLSRMERTKNDQPFHETAFIGRVSLPAHLSGRVN